MVLKSLVFILALLTTVLAHPSTLYDSKDKNGSCSNHELEGYTVRVCRSHGKNVQIQPLFVIEETAHVPVDYHSYLNTKTATHTVRLTSNKILKAVNDLPEYRKHKVEFVKVNTVRFLNVYQNVLLKRVQCSKLCPCFFFSDEETEVTEVESEQFTSLVLVAADAQNKCIEQVKSETIEDVVKAEYTVKKEKTVFHSGLQAFHGLTEVLVQQRVDGSMSFDKTWEEYEEGFGEESGNFWLGLKQLHELTRSGFYKVRFEMLSHGNDEWLWSEYNKFLVGSTSEKYRLNIGDFNKESTAGDSMANWDHSSVDNLNGMRFSTKDQDNDLNSRGSCSREFGEGGWWFNACMLSNPNGSWSDKERKNHQYMVWYTAINTQGTGHSLRQFRIRLIPNL